MRCFFHAQSCGLTKKITGIPRRAQLLGQLEMNVGKVDQHGHAGAPVVEGLLELAELAVDARQVAHHFGDAHDRHVFGTDHALQAGRGHLRPAHAEEVRRPAVFRQAPFQRLNQQRPIALAACLAGRDEDGCAIRVARTLSLRSP